MIPTAYILMYSGMQNPEKELSLGEIETLQDLVNKLDHPYPGQAHPHLGFSGYSASLSDEQYVVASLYGFVQVFGKDGLAVAYSDTTGVLAYLCKLMTPVMIQHNEDAAKALSQWFDPSFNCVNPPWEHNF